MNRWRPTWPDRHWASAALLPLTVVRSSAVMALVVIAGVVIVLLAVLVAALALGASFHPSTEKRDACLRTLGLLLRLAPWASKQ